MKLDPADVYDQAIIGTIMLPESNRKVVLYDKEIVLDLLVREMGMEDQDEAEEWYSYNILGAWMGEATPVFLMEHYNPDHPEEDFETGDQILPPKHMEAAVVGYYEGFGLDYIGLVYNNDLIPDTEVGKHATVTFGEPDMEMIATWAENLPKRAPSL